jgi:hypothetical protein
MCICVTGVGVRPLCVRPSRDLPGTTFCTGRPPRGHWGPTPFKALSCGTRPGTVGRRLYAQDLRGLAGMRRRLHAQGLRGLAGMRRRLHAQGLRGLAGMRRCLYAQGLRGLAGTRRRLHAQGLRGLAGMRRCLQALQGPKLPCEPLTVHVPTEGWCVGCVCVWLGGWWGWGGGWAGVCCVNAALLSPEHRALGKYRSWEPLEGAWVRCMVLCVGRGRRRGQGSGNCIAS